MVGFTISYLCVRTFLWYSTHDHLWAAASYLGASYLGGAVTGFSKPALHAWQLSTLHLIQLNESALSVFLHPSQMNPSLYFLASLAILVSCFIYVQLCPSVHLGWSKIGKDIKYDCILLTGFWSSTTHLFKWFSNKFK